MNPIEQKNLDNKNPLANKDPVQFSVILNRLNSIAVEMTIALAQTAFSALLSLTNDFSCCIYDAKRRQLAVMDALPVHTNSMHLFLEEIAERFGADLHPGDIIACNDPYSGNTHIGDLALAAPVFVDGEHILWVAVKAHQLDVGAPIPHSSYGGAENVWQEGLTIPPVKFYDKGKARDDVIDFYLANLRWRDRLHGDLKAQVGATLIGVRKLEEICRRYGNDVIRSFAEEVIEYAASRTGVALRSLPSGTYWGDAWFDEGEDGAVDLQFRCRVTIEGEAVSIDFVDCPAQLNRGVNASFAVLQAAGGIPVVMMIDPDIPHNEGCLRRVRVSAPVGSMCNASYPASTSMGTILPADAMQDAVGAALARAAPELACAGNARWANIPMFSGVDSRTGEFWGHQLLNSGGGGGAARGADGWPLITTSAARGGLRIASVEHTELLHPLHITEWEIEPNSMGLGAYIGGPGVCFSVLPLHGPVDIVYDSDGLRNPPFGVLGATPGAGGGSYIEEHSTARRRFLSAEVHVEVSPEESWVGISSGGGGYGNPLDRPIEQVRRDVRDGLYTAERAYEVYGVVLAGELDPVIDELATEDARRLIARLQEDEGVPLTLPNRPGASTWLEDNMRPGDQTVQ